MLFVNVTVCAALVSPISVPANVKLVGLAVNPPAVVEPVPLSVTVSGRAAGSSPSAIVNVAVSAPLIDGVKITPTEQVAPAPIEAPHAGPPGPAVVLVAKSLWFVPAIAAVPKVTVAAVLFVTVAYIAGELVPIITVPKFSVTGEIPIVGTNGNSATNALVTAPAGNVACATPGVVGNGVGPVLIDAVWPATYALFAPDTAMPFTASGICTAAWPTPPKNVAYTMSDIPPPAGFNFTITPVPLGSLLAVCSAPCVMGKPPG